MKVGLVARCDDRGLGHMCWDFARWMEPARVLVVRCPGHEAAGFAPHPERFPGATVVEQADDGTLPEPVVRGWLDGLDVLYTAETPYDWRLYGWCRAAGVASVCHVMPESWDPATPAPDAVWAPTGWLLERLPPGSPVVPVPVQPRSLDPGAEIGTPLRVLHVVGHRAGGDRNGTELFAHAVRGLAEPVRVRIETQDPGTVRIVSHGRTRVTVAAGGRVDRWAIYDDADVLVMPRRYGGLCLPVQEALAAGLGVVMTDCPPNREWPVLPVPATAGAPRLRTPTGRLPLWSCSVRVLAATVDRLAREPVEVAVLRRAARGWAERHAWPAMVGRYRDELAAVVERAAG